MSIEPTEQAASQADEARRALEEHYEFVEREPWLDIVEERFGIEASTFDDYFLVRANNRSLNLVPRDHVTLSRPAPEIVGMSFLRTRMRFPKITTAAAMAFGRQATRNYLALEPDQADDFLSRINFQVTAEQAATCTGTGYVIARVEEVVLGVGFLALEDDGAGAGQVRSLLPKAWTLADEESAFDN